MYKYFGAKVLGAIDLGTYHYLESCFTANKPEDISYNHLAWPNLHFNIIHNSLQVGLPPYMAKLVKPSASSNDEELEENHPARKKEKTTWHG